MNETTPCTLKQAIIPHLRQELKRGAPLYDAQAKNGDTSVNPFELFMDEDDEIPLSCREIASYVNCSTGMCLQSDHISSFLHGFNDTMANLLENPLTDETRGFYTLGVELRQMYVSKKLLED